MLPAAVNCADLLAFWVEETASSDGRFGPFQRSVSSSNTTSLPKQLLQSVLHFTARRVLLYTLRFTAKTYLFGPATKVTKDIIKKATVSYLTGTDTANTTREYSYSVVPRAIKNYTGDVATTLTDDITAKVAYIEVEDASTLSADSYIAIGDEEMYIKSITGNKLNVRRGEDNTTAAAHVRGAEVGKITAADNALIQEGDDFGFDGTF